MILYLFAMHHWEPQKYFSMSYNERKVIRALIEVESEEREEEIN